MRKVNWEVPISTDHMEYTVTGRCYLIDSGNLCSGCTMDGLEHSSDDEGFKNPMEPTFIIETAQTYVDAGFNLITYQGGEPLSYKKFAEVVNWTIGHETLNGLVYSSSSYLLRNNGSANALFYLYEQSGLFTSIFGYFKSSVDYLIRSKTEIGSNRDSNHGSKLKSFYGLMLAELLVQKGYSPAIHMTVKKSNIDQVLALYNWAKERNIRFSMCPMIWALYAERGVDMSAYSEHLTSEHSSQLQEICSEILNDTISRYYQGLLRIYVASSAFTRLLPLFGPMNSLSCRDHRYMLQPNTIDIHPNGKGRWCIAQDTEEQARGCPGCLFVGIDRGQSDYWHFEHLAGLQPDDIRFLNSDVCMKISDYDPSGANLFFDWQGNPL